MLPPTHFSMLCNGWVGGHVNLFVVKFKLGVQHRLSRRCRRKLWLAHACVERVCGFRVCAHTPPKRLELDSYIIAGALGEGRLKRSMPPFWARATVNGSMPPMLYRSSPIPVLLSAPHPVSRVIVRGWVSGHVNFVVVEFKLGV